LTIFISHIWHRKGERESKETKERKRKRERKKRKNVTKKLQSDSISFC